MRFLLILALSVVSFSSRAQNIQITDRVKAQRGDCSTLLVDTKQILTTLKAPDATVTLGDYNELQQLLVGAGVASAKAKETVDTLWEIHADAYNYPGLRYTAGMIDELVATKKLMICMISLSCALAEADSNFLFFSDKHEAVVMLPPASDDISFAINFIGSLAGPAAERILVRWLQAGFKQPTGDLYYRNFAHYRGEFPPRPESLDMGFTLVFISLYQILTSFDLTRILRPGDTRANSVYLAQTTLRDLRNGQNRELTAPVVDKLGITEQNFFVKARSILSTLVQTIEQ